MDAGRVLVTGATGFVGRAVVAALAATGRPLTLAVRHPPASLPENARVALVGEIGPLTDWGEALRDAEAVVHLAAHVHVAPERARHEAGLFDAVNHLGSERLYEQATASGVKTFVFLSSVTVLGSASRPGLDLDDGSPPRPETPYATSKLDAERALGSLASRPGAPTLVTLRPPLVAGPGVGGNLATLARLAASPWPLPLGGIANRRTLLSIDNLAGAILRVLEAPVAGAYLVGDTAPLSTSEIVRALREGAGRTAPILPLPGPLAAAASRLGGHARRLFGDMAIESGRFRTAYDWQDIASTRDTLRRTGAALARGGAGPGGESPARGGGGPAC